MLGNTSLTPGLGDMPAIGRNAAPQTNSAFQRGMEYSAPTGMTDGAIGTASRNRIYRDFGNAIRSVDQNMTSRGLYNSTVGQGERQELVRRRSDAVNQLDGSLRSEQAQTHALLSGQQLNAQQQMMMQRTQSMDAARQQQIAASLQTPLDALQFMERREDTYPSLDQIVALAQSLGQAQAVDGNGGFGGLGGGGGFIGGGNPGGDNQGGNNPTPILGNGMDGFNLDQWLNSQLGGGGSPGVGGNGGGGSIGGGGGGGGSAGGGTTGGTTTGPPGNLSGSAGGGSFAGGLGSWFQGDTGFLNSVVNNPNMSEGTRTLASRLQESWGDPAGVAGDILSTILGSDEGFWDAAMLLANATGFGIGMVAGELTEAMNGGLNGAYDAITGWLSGDDEESGGEVTEVVDQEEDGVAGSEGLRDVEDLARGVSPNGDVGGTFQREGGGIEIVDYRGSIRRTISRIPGHASVVNYSQWIPLYERWKPKSPSGRLADMFKSDAPSRASIGDGIASSYQLGGGDPTQPSQQIINMMN